MTLRARRLWLGGWMVLVWTALWGDLTVANLLGGALVAAALMVVFPLQDREVAPDAGLRLRPLAGLGFFGWFAKELAVANLQVAWAVVAPRGRIREAIVRVPLRTRSAAIQTLVADAVTLTPGTLTLDVVVDEDGVAIMYVHVLSLEHADATRGEVADLEARAVRAFGGKPDRLRVAEPGGGEHGGEGERGEPGGVS